MDQQTDVAPLEKLFSVRDAAPVVGLRENTLRDLIWRQRIRVVRVGNRVSIPESELRRLVSGQNT